MDLRRLTEPRALDAVLVAVGLALTALAVKSHWSPLPTPVVVLAGTVGSLGQWYRRRWPVAATAAGGLAFSLAGNPLPWLVGTYSGGAYAARRHLWAVGLLGWIGVAGSLWIVSQRVGASDAGYATVATALVIGTGVYAATRRELTASWRERAERAEAERRLRDEQARSLERTRIAREMHDVLAHKVSLIALHAGALELTASGTSPAVEQSAALIRGTAREALQELRYVLGLLRADGDPAAVDLADLAALVESSVRAGQPVELQDDAGPLPPFTARVAYRVVQEGLTNAGKHAPGAATTVSVQRDRHDVVVTVTNAASARLPLDLPGAGAGLVGLAERVRLAGGSLDSGPSAGGWRLRAVIPWVEAGIEETIPR